MKTCPYCKEAVHADATKCRYCQSALVDPHSRQPIQPGDERRVTYVVDSDLIRFAKFTVAVLAVFLVVGGFLFGFKLESSVEKIGSLQKDAEKTAEELRKSQADLRVAKSTVTALKLEVETLLSQARKTLEEIGKQRDVALAMVVSIRELTPAQEERLAQIQAAEPERVRRGPAQGFEKLWHRGTTLRIGFIGGTPQQRELVAKIAVEWTKYANLDFNFVDGGETDVRVAFDPMNGSWSFRGFDARAVGKDEPTVNLSLVDRPSILHEFGHVLGLIEEHQNPNANIRWNREAVYKTFQAPPNSWSKRLIEESIFRKEPRELLGGYRDFDPTSIMTAAFPASLTGGKSIGGGTDLSESDKQFARKLYPGR